MTDSNPDLSTLIAASKQYAVDRPSRRELESAFNQLRATDKPTLAEAASRLRRSTEPAERALAALLSPELGETPATELIISLIEEDDDPAVLIAAAEALRGMTGAAASTGLKHLAQHADPVVRRTVAESFYGKSDSTSFETLLELLNDEDPETRDWAAWALADTFNPNERRDEALTEWLKLSDAESQLTGHVRSSLETTDSSGDHPRSPLRRSRPHGRRAADPLPTVITVLVASANPLETGQLALDEEVRSITTSLRATPARDRVELKTAWAQRPLDLLTELNEHQPQVLHFSGHGTADGRLVFVDESGGARPVDGEAIAATLAAAGRSVRVVVLNACFTHDLAQALVAHVDVAIGMNRPIGDVAAKVFATAFYSALGYGLSVATAFEQSLAALLLEGIPEDTTPELSARNGIDPSELVLVDRARGDGVSPETDRAALQEISNEHLSHLATSATLPVGAGLSVRRGLAPVLRMRAESGSMVVVGPQGKTGALHQLATELREAGRDVVVLAADLLHASGRRGLREELGIRLDLIDALAAWDGADPAFLLIDSLDSARGREASATLLDLISRIANVNGRWRVVVSVRSFDLRHNHYLRDAMARRSSASDELYVDAEFSDIRHLATESFSDSELEELQVTAPRVSAFLANASVEVVGLAHVPFNLRLLVNLLESDPVETEPLHQLRTQLELLDLYWARRVIAPAEGRDAREWIANRVAQLALCPGSRFSPQIRSSEFPTPG